MTPALGDSSGLSGLLDTPMRGEKRSDGPISLHNAIKPAATVRRIFHPRASRMLRILADLPWQGVLGSLHLHVRRSFCDEPSYESTTFAGRLLGLVDRHARRIGRLEDWFTHISSTLDGEAKTRLLHGLGVRVSGDTPPSPPPFRGLFSQLWGATASAENLLC